MRTRYARDVVITGGTSGVGRAAARAFAARGDRVALVARGEEALEATADELRPQASDVRTFPCDVTDAGALEAVAADVEAEWGRVDVWVNSAAVAVLGRFGDVATEDFDRVMDVVLGGTVNGTRAALRCMQRRGRGHIVQIGSAVAFHGVPLQAPYSAAKHGVHGFCDAVRAELLHDDSEVTVSEVNLPAINTPLYRSAKNLLPQAARPFPPVYQPETAGRAVLHAADTGVRRVDVTATATAYAWADACMAGLLEHMLGRLGLDLQQTGAAADQPSDDSLHKPLPGDHGCHGGFGAQARPASLKERVRHVPMPWRTLRVADRSSRVVADALTELASRSGLVPRR